MAQQQQQKAAHDQRARGRSFAEGQTVLVKNWRDGPRWVRGVIISCSGDVHYEVDVGENNPRRCHADQLLSTQGQPTITSAPQECAPGAEDDDIFGEVTSTPNSIEEQPVTEDTMPADNPADSPQATLGEQTPQSARPVECKTYPRRNRVPRVLFDPSFS